MTHFRSGTGYRSSMIETVIFTLSTVLVLMIEHAASETSRRNEHQHASSSSSSDCDRQFNSLESKSGLFTSPYYPKYYGSDRTCKYTFQGEGRERVQIVFTDLDLYLPPDELSTDQENHSCEEYDSITVTVNIGDVPRDLVVFCGNKKPPMLMSHNSRMEVTFASRSSEMSIMARGFKANYSFVTDFGIKSGIHDPNMVCGFTFLSNISSNGTFTSPNFPGLYPRNTECHYLFYGSANDCIHITFPYFDVEGVLPGCQEDTQSDYVEFSNFNVELMDRKMSRFCGMKSEQMKKAVSSDGNFFRVTFKSNEVFDATGFEAFYQFRKIEDPYTNKQSKSTGAFQSAVGIPFWSSLLFVLFAQAFQLSTSSTTMTSLTTKTNHRSMFSRC